MPKALRTVLIIVGFVAVFATIGIFAIKGNQMEMNPDGTIGNTAGNLNNSGLFVEQDGVVYFSNVTDNNYLYSMNSDESNVKCLAKVAGQNLLQAGKYLYYFQRAGGGSEGLGGVQTANSFGRMTIKDGSTTSLLHATVLKGQLVDNYLYLMTEVDNNLEFQKIKIDKSESKILANYELNPACAANGSIYYYGVTENHFLYRLDCDTENASTVLSEYVWYPEIYNGYIYYMDITNNYRICRYSMSENRIEVLTNDRVDTFNVNNGYVYYATSGDSYELKCMRADGSDCFTLAEGVFCDINMTSRYVYFKEYGIDSVMYHSALGSTTYTRFSVLESN